MGRVGGIAVLLLLLCACQYDPYTYSYATSKPDHREMIGHWVPTDDTLHGLAGSPYEKAHPTLDVLEDGSIRMNDIPDTWQAEFGEGAGKVESFVGTWRLYRHQDSWWGLLLGRGDWGCAGCLMVLGDESPRRLVLRFGDPDAGQGYEFRLAGAQFRK